MFTISLTGFVAPACACKPRLCRAHACTASTSARRQEVAKSHESATRRHLLELASLGLGLAAVRPAFADDYTVTPSGLRYFDVRTGNGRSPRKGDFVLLDWSGFTEGYQGKRIGNSTKTDEPFRFQLGAGQAIPAIEEAVQSMSVGGVRRVEIPGSKPELGYPLNKSERFSGQRLTGDYFK